MISRHTDRHAPKSALRQSALRQRRALDPTDRAKLSVAVQRRFLRSRLFFSSNAVGCYIAMDDEVDTSLIIERAWRARKSIYVPATGRRGSMDFVRIDRDSTLVRNAFGIWEPAGGMTVPGRELDVVVTPVAAFDCERNRIGMGGGFYDRHFAYLVNRDAWLHPKLVGLAFACQYVEAIDKDAWDVSLHRVIDESGIH